MNCSAIDLHGYFLDEIEPAGRRAVEEHLPSCRSCAEQLARLRITQTAMMAVRDEEMPRRIAFVSDKVFEPKWYERLFRSWPAAGMASAAMLALAIVGHGFASRPSTPAPVPVAAADIEARVESRVRAEMAGQIDRAIAKAVAEVDDRAGRRAEAMVTAAVARVEKRRLEDLAYLEASVDWLRREVQRYKKSAYLASAGDAGANDREGKP